MVLIIEPNKGTTDTGGAMIGTPANSCGFIVLPILFCPIEVKWDWRRGVLIETVIV